MPWQAHHKYFKPASVLPPHVIIYAYIKEVGAKMENILSAIKKLLDKCQMMGQLFPAADHAGNRGWPPDALNGKGHHVAEENFRGGPSCSCWWHEMHTNT